MRKLIILNVFDAFISGAYMLIIPLLLIKRNISLSIIGFIFSIFPVVFLVSRLIFASAAEKVGYKKFFNINALGNFSSASIRDLKFSFSLCYCKRASRIKGKLSLGC
jgi:MFS family permease